MTLPARLFHAGAIILALWLAGTFAASAQTSDLFTGFQSNSKDPIQIGFSTSTGDVGSDQNDVYQLAIIY